MPTVDVIIPTWNRRERVLAALASLAAQTMPHRVIVVDNGSVDGTAEAVAEQFPATQVIRLPSNLGFGRAVNLGILAGLGEFVVILNNDVEAEPDFVAEIIQPFADPLVGSVAGVLTSADGRTVDAAGVVLDRSLAGYSYRHGAAEVGTGEPFAPCGGAAAYRRAVLEEVGCYDEEIFAYSEDVELGLRMSAAGVRNVAAGRARARHLGSATLGHRSPAQLRLSSWSRGYVLGRYRVGLRFVLLELALAVLDCLANRSAVPVLQRARGYRRGRALPPRPVPGVAYLPMVTGLSIRWAAFRGRY